MSCLNSTSRAAFCALLAWPRLIGTLSTTVAPSAVGFCGSVPWITERTSAASVALRAIGPVVSCCAEIGTTPVRLTRPRDGRTPTRPLIPDGQRIEPFVSEPIATVASAAATATAEPLLEPHGLRSRTYGLAVAPPTALQPLDTRPSRNAAHSVRFALPRITAPAARRRATRKLSCPGCDESNANEPAVVGIS